MVKRCTVGRHMDISQRNLFQKNEIKILKLLKYDLTAQDLFTESENIELVVGGSYLYMRYSR